MSKSLAGKTTAVKRSNVTCFVHFCSICRDPVQLRLIREIEDNTEQMTKINRSLIDANIVLRSLQRNQLELEDAINVKMITISIDETQVIPLRKTIRIQDF